MLFGFQTANRSGAVLFVTVSLWADLDTNLSPAPVVNERFVRLRTLPKHSVATYKDTKREFMNIFLRELRGTIFSLSYPVFSAIDFACKNSSK